MSGSHPARSRHSARNAVANGWSTPYLLFAFYSNANMDMELTDDTLCEVLAQVQADLIRIEVLTKKPG